MDLFSALGATMRRWYVAVPILLIAGFFAFQQQQSAVTTWSSQGSLVLLPPSTEAGTAAAGNSVISAGGTRLLSQLLADNANSVEARSAVAAQGTGGAYVVAANSRLPLLTVTTTAEDAAAASATLTVALEQIQPVLDSLQDSAGVSEEGRYRVVQSEPPTAPLSTTTTTSRAILSIAAAGIALAVLLSVAVDTLARRRREGADLADQAQGGVQEPGGAAPAPEPKRHDGTAPAVGHADAATTTIPVLDRDGRPRAPSPVARRQSVRDDEGDLFGSFEEAVPAGRGRRRRQ